MRRPSFVPPIPIRRLRDLTRYRMSLVSDQSAQKNRVEKLLEDAQLKLPGGLCDAVTSPPART
jgi:transposase